jgi:hypothetical protein
MPILALLSKTSFDPAITDILASAFDVAWERLQNSGSPLAAEESAAATRETLAKNIIAAAQTGERDKNRLVESALSRLAIEAPPRQAASSGDSPTT